MCSYGVKARVLTCKCLRTLKSHAHMCYLACNMYCIQSEYETYQALVSKVAPPEAVLSNNREGSGGRSSSFGQYCVF